MTAAPALPRWFDALTEDEQTAFLQLADLEAHHSARYGDLGPPEARFEPAWLKATAPASWTWTWPHQTYCYPYLNALFDGDLLRCIFVLPPRHTKTEGITVRFPAYWLERCPDQHVILGTHTQKLANKISRKIRRLALGRFTLSPDRAAVEEWDTTAGGGLRAVGVGVGIAGYGANLLLIDDPIKRRKDAESPQVRDAVWTWYTDDLYTRLEPDARIILTMQRWHEDDPVGRILNSADAKSWTVVHLPALALEDDALGRQPGQALCPARFDEMALAQIRLVEGSYGFSGRYQGYPAPPEGGIIKRTWWRFHAPGDRLRTLQPVQVRTADGGFTRSIAVPTPLKFPFMAESWDCAFKDAAANDFVCGQVWGKLRADCYLLDQVYQHLDLPGTLDAVRELTRQWPTASAKWVEDKANGPAVIQTLRREIPGLIAVEPQGKKTARAHAVAPIIEAGNVFLPHPDTVPTIDGHNWVLDLIDSCATLPTGAHDDDADALTQALNRLQLIPGEQPGYMTVQAHV